MWNYIKKYKNNHNLLFVHTPKCGGSYAAQIFKDLDIKNIGHNKLSPSEFNNYITFTIIRNPIDRFESFLNFRLNSAIPRIDWPKRLRYLHYDNRVSLNQIVAKFKDNEFFNFIPYRTLVYWTKDIDIVITIDELPSFLNFFGYTYNINSFSKVNVSKKKRGYFNENTKKRLQKLFKDDMIIFNKINENTIDSTMTIFLPCPLPLYKN